jgi:spore maturation protein SpmB
MFPLLPSVSDAQRLPARPRSGPARPTSMPDLPPSVAREMSYRRLPVAVESYPLVARYEADGFAGGASSWTSFGMGTRADYRVAKYLSATVDMTSAIVGGPALAQTFEVGGRVRPERGERTIYPFLDLRVGYVHAFDGRLGAMDFIDPVTSPVGTGSRYSHGFGGVAGAGVEFGVTTTLSLTTAASVLQTRMHPYGFSGLQPQSQNNTPYSLRSQRYTIGVRWNPVRFLNAPGSE